MAQTPNKSRGFTLIELLVVLAIIGILAAAGAFFSQDKVPSAVRSTMSELAGTFRNAQSLARNSGQAVYLRTTGGGAVDPRVEWGFLTFDATGNQVFGDVQGAWTIPAADGRFVSVGVGNADLATTGEDPSSVSAITLNTTASSVWNAALFPGSSTPNTSFWFLPNGAPNAEFFVSVVGRRGGAVFSTKNTVGVVVVNPNSGINGFVKKAGSSTWSRL